MKEPPHMSEWMSKRLRDLSGLGPKTEACLIEAGIQSPEELHAIGAVPAFLKLESFFGAPQNMNFLYALVAAIEDRSWNEVARNDKARLLAELDDHRQLNDVFK